MPIETKGSFALTFCNLSAPLPEDYLARLNQGAAGKLDNVKDEPEIAWVSGRHLLETEIDENTSILGGHLHINLRKAERKIPSSLLSAICRRDELAYMLANQTAIVPRQMKKQIKEEAIEKNLMKMPPTISATTVAVNRAFNEMYAATGSQSVLDTIVSGFIKDLDVEPIPMTINEMMIRFYKEEANALPNIIFGGKTNAAGMDPTPGRDFLTWLWYISEVDGGALDLGEWGSFQLGIEGPLVFGFSSGEAQGAEESVVKKGCPQLSAEAKAALAVGKKLKRAKILLVRDQEIWTFTFDADKFTFSGVNLPEGEENEPHSLFEERAMFLHIMKLAVEGYFKKFVDTVTGADRAEFERDVRKWASERESY